MASMALPSGTVTFVFTDIEGSTRLLQELGDGYAKVVADHRRIVRETFGEHGGSEIDTQGDAFFFSFPRARDAVAAAVAAQRALHAHEWTGGREPRVRMGLHTGEPSVSDEGYLGLDVVRASRIAGAGHGGQILISETTRALLGNAVPEGTAVLDLGDHALKDIQHEHIYELSLDPENRETRPLNTEPRPKSTGELLAERIRAHVEQQIEEAFTKRQRPDRPT
jgi:class 3 adenylate cyclase